MRIAQLQLSADRTKQKTLEHVIELCQQLPDDIDLVCLPEMFCCPYDTKQFPDYAEETNGFIDQTCAQIAKKGHFYLSAGTYPRIDDAHHIYNCAHIFDPEGRLIGEYDKMHLFDIDIVGQYFKESDTLTPGQHICVIPTELTTFGVMICYDVRFPELGRTLATQGAKVCIVPASFNMTTGPVAWELSLRALAMQQQMYVIATSASFDQEASYHAYGHSLVVDPWGTIINECDEKEHILITEIDLDLVDEVRERLPLLKHYQ